MKLAKATREAVQDALKGKRVTIFFATMTAARQHFIDFKNEDLEVASEGIYRMVNGQEEVRFPGGGYVRFQSANHSARGVTLDRFYAPVGLSEERTAEITPTIATGGKAIWYQ